MMAETKVDAQSPSVTTVPSYSAPKTGTGIALCLSYFRTGPGIVKLVQLVSTRLVMSRIIYFLDTLLN